MHRIEFDSKIWFSRLRFRTGRWTSRSEDSWAAPEIEMAENFLDYIRVIDEGNHPHLFLADRTLQRVDMPSLTNQVAPFSGRKLERRRRRTRGQGFEFGKLKKAIGSNIDNRYFEWAAGGRR